MKKLAALASMAALLCASTSFAKKAMDEEEMELVTAAGQPAVIVVDHGSNSGLTSTNIIADEMGTLSQAIGEGSQTNLRALALNNVAGENQVANGTNIRSGVATTGVDAAQINEINQSWGATFDWSAVPGTATVGDAGDGGDVTLSGTVGDVKITCVAIGQGCEATATAMDLGGDGGDAASAVLPTVRLSAYADKIIGVTDVGSGALINISQMNDQTITQIIESDSQSSLAALALNNVVGSNQVANGVNVASQASFKVGTDFSNTALDTFPQVKADSLGTATYNGTQRNTINQYRGTPLTRPDALPLVPLVP